MPESDKPADYDRTFDPAAYLRQFYSAPVVSDDEAVMFGGIEETVKRGGRLFPRALEVGCGPTLHHAFALAPLVGELHLAEYLPGNRAEVGKWLDGAPAAHDWDVYFRGVLAAEGDAAGAALGERKRLLREKVTALLPCDLRAPSPLGSEGGYDLVVSFYTAEAVGGTLAEWEAMTGRILDLVSPGGTALIGAVRECRAYKVLDRSFPTTPVNGADFARVLSKHGFDVPGAEIREVPIATWVDEGFSGVCFVCARRAPAGARGDSDLGAER